MIKYLTKIGEGGIPIQHVKIKVYVTPGCPHCRRVKEYLRKHGFRFKEIDVSKDPREADRLYKKAKVMAVPVVEIGNRIVVGFDRAKIDRLLGLD